MQTVGKIFNCTVRVAGQVCLSEKAVALLFPIRIGNEKVSQWCEAFAVAHVQVANPQLITDDGQQNTFPCSAIELPIDLHIFEPLLGDKPPRVHRQVMGILVWH